MAERHQDEKKMTGLLRKSIVAASGARQESCPDPELLAAYCERSLNDSEIASVEEHFATCSLCRESLAAVARSEPPAEKAKSGGWNWSSLRLWVTPLAVAAAMFIFWLGRQSLRISKPPQAPAAEVAQLKSAPLRDAQSLPLNGRVSDSLQTLAPKAVAPGKDLDHLAAFGTKKEKVPAREMPSPGRSKNSFSNSPLGGGLAGGTASAAAGSLAGRAAEKRSDEEAKQSSDSFNENMERDSKVARKEMSAPRGAPSAPAPAPPSMPAPQASPAPSAPAVPEIMKKNSQKSAVDKGNVAKESESNKSAQRAGIFGTSPQSEQAITAKGLSPGGRSLQLMIYSPDANVMWRISGKGKIELSKNGGRDWQSQSANT
ncbi:MAG: zf-HC2 domain-containing protein, partial [Candidatus Acidiferrales bacterium]